MIKIDNNGDIIRVKENTPLDPPKEKEPVIKSAENKQIIENAETEIKLLRLDFERKKLIHDLKSLDKPDTSIDYYSKMLEMQNTFNNNVLAMQKANFDLQLQIAKMEFMDDDPESEWMGLLEKYAPALIGMLKKDNQNISDVWVRDDKGNIVMNPNNYKADGTPLINTSKDIDNKSVSAISDAGQSAPVDNPEKMDIEKTQQLIRQGKLSLEDAWRQYQAEKEFLPPPWNNYNFETFTKLYNKIKNS